MRAKLRHALPVLLLAAATLGVACRGGSSPNAKLSPEGTAVGSTPVAALTTLPSPTPAPQATTGVPIVDAVVAAVLGRRVTDVELLIDYRDVPCTSQQQGIGAPPACPPGAQEGTPVRAITFGNCEGGYSTKDDFESRLASNVSNIDRVFSASRTASGYAVIFTYSRFADGAPVSGPAMGTAWMLSARGLTSTVSGCGASALGLAARYRDFLIPPPPAPPPPANLRRTGQPGVDLTIEEVATRDLLALLDRIVYQQIPCQSGSAPSGPYCPRGAAAGTPVSAFPLSNCGRDFWHAPGDMASNLDMVLRIAPRVYAISRAPEGLRYTYRVVIQDIQPVQAHVLGLDQDGRPVWIDIGCNAKAEDLLGGAQEFVLPPLGP